MRFAHNGEFVDAGQKINISYKVANSINTKGKVSSYTNLLYSGIIEYTAPKTGFLNITFKINAVHVDINTLLKIKSKDATRYYSNEITYKVSLSDISGSLVNKTVRFKVNYEIYTVKTDENGVATLKVNLEPGKYTVKITYGKNIIRNKITVKTTLITKNINKKVGKSTKFNVKVLNEKGKPYAKQLVKVKFMGKTYKIKTNSKGIASFKVPNNLKIGKYAIKTTYNGLTNTNKVIVKK